MNFNLAHCRQHSLTARTCTFLSFTPDVIVDPFHRKGKLTDMTSGQGQKSHRRGGAKAKLEPRYRVRPTDSYFLSFPQTAPEVFGALL